MATSAKFTPRKRSGGINITPFVDVLLVVLVIFILTSNASIPGIKVDLPKASSAMALEKPKTKAITIDNAGQVFLDAYPVTLPELEERLRTEKALDARLPRDRARRCRRAVRESGRSARLAAPHRPEPGGPGDRQAGMRSAR